MKISLQFLATIGVLFSDTFVNAVAVDLELMLMEDEPAEKLAFLNADPDAVTISGASAGAFFACNMQIILSDTIKGAGCSAGAAIGWGPGQFKKEGITAEMMSQRSIELIDELESAGHIDPVSNLADRAVYLWSGKKDTIVPPHNQEAMRQVFEHYGTENLHFELANRGHSLR